MKKVNPYRSLFLSRPLLNAEALIGWAKANGFPTTLGEGELHVTIAYSKQALEWPDTIDDTIIIPSSNKRALMPLGDKGAVVLRFDSPTLQGRHQELLDAGASYDFPSYRPHITITWEAPTDLDINSIHPFEGSLELGPEIARIIDENWKDNVTEKAFTFTADILKMEHNDDQRLAWGWASVTHKDGSQVLDLQNDLIDSDELVKATTEFMENIRAAKAMHVGDSVGTVVHSFPLTKELASSLGIEAPREGWIVGVKVADDATWQRVKSGELRAFSIGGTAEREDLED